MVRFITQTTPKRPPKRGPRSAAQKAAQAELDAAREAAAARRQDTRRKVVIGAALMNLAERDRDAADMLARLMRGLTRPADRKLFGMES